MRPLISRYPEFYAGSAEFLDIQNALEPEIRALWERRDSVLDQLNVETATWGLKYWEKSLGLVVDEGADLDFRRSRIKAKRRGAGTTTVAMIQNLAASYSNGEVEVLEYPDQFRIEIKFVNTTGAPPNINDLTATLREILPAHLEWDYVIVYATWNQLSTHTWDEMSGLTWTEAKELTE